MTAHDPIATLASSLDTMRTAALPLVAAADTWADLGRQLQGAHPSGPAARAISDAGDAVCAFAAAAWALGAALDDAIAAVARLREAVG